MKRLIKRKILFLFLFTLLFNTEGYGQTISLGTASTDINGINTSSPINIWFRKTVCQMVYTAAELSAEGAVASSITELGFFVTNNPIYNLPNYQIQIKHTTATNAAGSLEGGYTTVKTIADYAPGAGGWDMLVLDTPFDWDGVSNIAVRICWSQVTPTYDPSGQLRVYNAPSGYKYRRTDGGGSACGQVPTTVLNTKPQLRLKFQSETEWTGAINNDWFNVGNWTAAVPSETINAVIPAGTPNTPNLTSEASCMSLVLSGTMTMGLNGILHIYDDFTNTGTYNDLGGTTDFTGLEAHTINTTTDLTIENLLSNSSAGLIIESGNVILGNELVINKGVFDTGDNLTLRSDANGTARIDELSTTCTYTLNMTDVWGDGWNGGFITVFEDGVDIGTFSGALFSSSATFQVVNDATFVINYTAGSFENENAYTLTDESGTVLFSDGVNPSTGDVYTDVASGCSFSSTLTGDITMQRYIDEGETYWRYFASAVENPMISQYLDDFTTAGFPGTPFPDFPFTSIYYYDETMPPGAGYVPCPSTAQVIGVGQGYQVWSGDTITGTDPFVVDLEGPPNQGDINMPVTYTPSGTPSQDGWCLVGNPYPSTIDWGHSGWTKTNMADATYIQNPDTQNYATYISGAGANGGSRYIASQQSFWVHAIAPAPVLTIRETVKSNVDATYFRAGEIHNQGMTVQLNGGPITDEVVLRHIEGASDAFEPEVDAVKLFGGWGVYPQLTLLNEEETELTVHSIDKGFSEWEIPLKTVVFESGLYELKFLNVFELDVPCLKLEDTYTGEFYTIEEETVLPFELMDTMTVPRFIIHLGREYEYERENVSCNGLTDGEFELNLEVDETIPYELSADGYFVADSTTGAPFSIADLPAGGYTLYLEGLENLCGVDTFHFNIHEPTVIESSAIINDEAFGADGAITVEAEGGTAPYTYNWSTGATTNMITGLIPGIYDVVITDANNCETESSYTVGSSLEIEEKEAATNITFNYDPIEKQITITGTDLNADNTLYLFAITGELITAYKLNATDSANQISLSQELAKGIYVLRPLDSNWVYKFSY